MGLPANHDAVKVCCLCCCSRGRQSQGAEFLLPFQYFCLQGREERLHTTPGTIASELARGEQTPKVELRPERDLVRVQLIVCQADVVPQMPHFLSGQLCTFLVLALLPSCCAELFLFEYILKIIGENVEIGISKPEMPQC